MDDKINIRHLATIVGALTIIVLGFFILTGTPTSSWCTKKQEMWEYNTLPRSSHYAYELWQTCKKNKDEKSQEAAEYFREYLEKHKDDK